MSPRNRWWRHSLDECFTVRNAVYEVLLPFYMKNYVESSPESGEHSSYISLLLQILWWPEEVPSRPLLYRRKIWTRGVLSVFGPFYYDLLFYIPFRDVGPTDKSPYTYKGRFMRNRTILQAICWPRCICNKKSRSGCA